MIVLVCATGRQSVAEVSDSLHLGCLDTWLPGLVIKVWVSASTLPPSIVPFLAIFLLPSMEHIGPLIISMRLIACQPLHRACVCSTCGGTLLEPCAVS